MDKFKQLKEWVCEQDGLFVLREKENDLEIAEQFSGSPTLDFQMITETAMCKITDALRTFQLDWFVHINDEQHLTIHVFRTETKLRKWTATEK